MRKVSRTWVKVFAIIAALMVVISIIGWVVHITNKHKHKEVGTTITINAKVSKNKAGAGVYNTIMEALAAAPAHSDQRHYIHVEAGLYVEQVQVWENLTNIVLIGDEALTTKIQWSRNNDSADFSTSDTATLNVRGAGFTAMYMVFENNAGDGIAVMTEANHTAFYRCIFIGYQDTLYAKGGVQFYKNCDIYGTVDLIFGAATALFQNCHLYARKSTSTVTFTAQNKGGPNTNTDTTSGSGFVIQGCDLMIAPGFEQDKHGVKAYLGRPWSNYSTVVVMESYLDSIVQPAGWLAWENRSTDGLTYVEFANRGEGADTRQRVNWKGYQDLSGHTEKVKRFTVGQFIDQDGWLAATGIPYSTGLLNTYN